MIRDVTNGGSVERCDHEACDNLAAFEPVLLLWPKGRPQIEGFESRFTLGLKICPSCAQKITAETLLTQERWYRIVSELTRQKRETPDRASAIIDWKRIA